MGSPCSTCAPTLQAGAPGGAHPGLPVPKPCAGIGMLASLPGRGSGKVSTTRLPPFPSLLALCRGSRSRQTQGRPASPRWFNKEGRVRSASRGRLESHQRPGDAVSEGARSFGRAPRPG